MSSRCYCGEPIRADGHCRYRCDPALKPSVLRSQRAKAKRKAHAARVDSEHVRLSRDEQVNSGAALAKVDPLYGLTRRRTVRAAMKSHRPGARR